MASRFGWQEAAGLLEGILTARCAVLKKNSQLGGSRKRTRREAVRQHQHWAQAPDQEELCRGRWETGARDQWAGSTEESHYLSRLTASTNTVSAA